MFAPRGWFKRPVPQMIYRTLQGSALFNKVWYRSTQLSALEKLVDPIWHYLDTGWKNGLDPSPSFDTTYYLAANPDVQELGLNPLFHYLKYGIVEQRHPVHTSVQALEKLVPSTSALRLITVPDGSPARISVVIDDHTPRDSGLPYARILLAGFELARTQSVRLRIIDRRSLADDLGITELTRVFSIKSSYEYRALGTRNDGDELPRYGDEVFIATSWSSAQALLKAHPLEHLRYLHSDNEARLYGDSDAADAANSTLLALAAQLISLGSAENSDAKPKKSAEVGPVAWAPSFSSYTPTRQSERDKPTILVDLDSHASGNRVSSTLETLSTAVAKGIIDTKRHDVILISSSTQPVNLSGSLVPELHSATRLTELLDLAARCDVLITLARPGCLGLLELATLAHGGTVITRYQGNQTGAGRLVTINQTPEAALDALNKNVNKNNG
jgi:hypothetical protein